MDRLPRSLSFAADAFTLIELLVVITIIAVLASLILPTFGRTKNKAHAILCLNNARQLQISWTMFASDHEDHLPPISDKAEAGKGTNFPSWVAGRLRTQYEKGDKSDNTNESLLIGVEYAQFGSIGTYAGNPGVYKCPGDQSRRVRSISMNSYINGVGLWQDTNFLTFSKLGDIQNPANIWVFIDEREDSINDGYFAVDMASRYAIIDYPASYHNGSGVIVFADGHAQQHRWLEGTTAPPLRRGYHLPGDSKITLAGDRDVEWLLARTTVEKN